MSAPVRSASETGLDTSAPSPGRKPNYEDEECELIDPADIKVEEKCSASTSAAEIYYKQLLAANVAAFGKAAAAALGGKSAYATSLFEQKRPADASDDNSVSTDPPSLRSSPAPKFAPDEVRPSNFLGKVGEGTNLPC